MAKTECGRPQILQRVYSLVENFCLRCCLIFIAVLRKYGICRICFRELAYKGQIPGVKKASW